MFQGVVCAVYPNECICEVGQSKATLRCMSRGCIETEFDPRDTGVPIVVLSYILGSSVLYAFKHAY